MYNHLATICCRDPQNGILPKNVSGLRALFVSKPPAIVNHSYSMIYEVAEGLRCGLIWLQIDSTSLLRGLARPPRNFLKGSEREHIICMRTSAHQITYLNACSFTIIEKRG